LDHAGKGFAQVITANGQIVASEENITAAFKRADRHAERAMRIDVEITVAEYLCLGSAASGGVLKLNETAEPTAGAAVGDQNCTTCGRCVEELREASGCAADRAAVVSDCAVGRGRAAEILEKHPAAGCAAGRAGVVSKCAIGGGRVVE